MTGTVSVLRSAPDTFDQTPVRHHPSRWRLSRAGFVNVWHYYENTFAISGGRLILRGTNGSGKSRALEMLLPFLLDADRRNMGTGSSVRMEDLMSAGAGDQTNRLGYMWLELSREAGPNDSDGSAGRHLTLGAHVRFSVSTKEAKVWYFTTPLRVGQDLPLLGHDRQPMSRKDLAELIGEERITDVPDKHRERVRAEVFGLTGHLGRERFDGLVKLLHTLRSPDVGNRIEEGRLPAILADALPPLSEDALTDAGQQLDGLTSTREDQQRLEAARDHVRTFLEVYQRYATGVLAGSVNRMVAAVAATRAAVREQRQLKTQAEQLAAEAAAHEALLHNLESRAEELAATLDALKDSEAYRSAENLTQLATIVAAQANSADSRLKAAADSRDFEKSTVEATSRLADDIATAAATANDSLRAARELSAGVGLTDHALPAGLRCAREQAPARIDVIRTGRDREPQEIIRPAADRIVLEPSDMNALADAATRLHAVAGDRARQALNRAVEARALAQQKERVATAQDAAEAAAAAADEAAATAELQAERRDDAALALVDGWRTWLAQPDTIDLLGPVSWPDHPILGPLSQDRTSLCGDGASDPVSLTDLDRGAEQAATSARDLVTGERARLDTADGESAAIVKELEREHAALRAARDPEPRLPHWVTAADGVPLWRCVDFADHVHDTQRAGIEAALLASGLLTATVDENGTVAAADGQLLVSPRGGTAAHPLSGMLLPDPQGPLPAGTITAVLDRIGYGDASAHTWIWSDGSWGNGPLRGRHTQTTARHIGAAARAAARAQRLAAIDAELEAHATLRRERQIRRDEIEARVQKLAAHVRTAPQSRQLSTERAMTVASVQQATRAAQAAGKKRVEADGLARAYADEARRHQATCDQFGLPTDEEPLRNLHTRANDAARACQQLAAHTVSVADRLQRHTEAVEKSIPGTQRRVTVEDEAAAALMEWQNAATRYNVLNETMGAATADVRRRVTDAEHTLKSVTAQIKTTTGKRTAAIAAEATAAERAAAAASRATDQHASLGIQVTAVLDQLAQPGIIATAMQRPPAHDLLIDLSPDTVDTDAATLLAGLRRGRADENALLRAQQTFEHAISTSYDVHPTISAGIRLFELSDADGRRPLAQAAIDIAQQCETGRAALTQREQQVFTDFVLGEVGEELRRRLAQATELIAAMNNSLRTIQTSHGIGVRLTWKLSEDAGADIARIRQLITTAASVRTQAQDDELTGMLSERVAAAALHDPSGGYAAHLRAALDYRAWHAVEVIITGPEPGRERRISRRAKLSQGETRFVSYVTLFAAVDAYLSGLENSAMSLRLILLDDAFAKVDEPTIAELLGLLVRLDLDFAMTGHALYGCVPQVPSLDVYEILRHDGSPAVTSHLHWDGRNRHLRPV